jgi:endonuclease/exonuclease/phosphatase (EEP) superfamily protein YafD
MARRRPRTMAILRLIVALCAVAIVITSVLPLGARVSWVLDLFAHFRVQYLAAGVVLLALLAATRQPRLALLVLGSIALNGAAVIDYLPSLGRSSTADAASDDRAAGLRVMTVNLSQSAFEIDRLLAIIRTESPDVLLLVEFTHRSLQELKALDAQYPYRVKEPRVDAFGAALFSRHELTKTTSVDLMRTVAIQAEVNAPSGAFTFIGVHLRAPMHREWTLERNRQLEMLATWRAAVAGPLIVAGDFNITPYSPYFASWIERTRLHDARAGRMPGMSWPAVLPILGIPIDHCLVSDDFDVTDVRRLPAFGSDHYPVIATVRLRSAQR